MKPGLLFLLLAGAMAALLSTWWLLGSSSGAPAGPANALEAGQDSGGAPASPGNADLGAVQPRPGRDGPLREVGRQSLTQRSRGSSLDAPGAAEPATGPYFGRLLDHLGRPMAAVEITFASWEDAARAGGMTFAAGRRRKPEVATTGEDGRFSVTTKKPLGRSLGLTSVVAGYSDAPVRCVLEPGKGRDLGDVVLLPAVHVSGWVRDADGRSIADARVRRVDRNGDITSELMDNIGFGGLVEAARTDADGRFEMPHEKEGAITLQIEGDDILPKRWDGPTRRAGEVLQDVEILVESAGRIDGYVLGYPPGRRRGLVAAAILHKGGEEDAPTSGISELLAAQLSPAGDHTTTIEADGSFSLTGLVPGARYRLRAITKNLFVRTVELSKTADGQVGGDPVTLEFEPGTTVTFQAIDAKTQEPIEALRVSGKYGSDPAFLQLSRTAENPPGHYPAGKVSLYELRPKPSQKTLTLTIDAPGYFRTRDIDVDVPPTGGVNLGKIALAPAPLLKIRVVDAATGKPVKRARVTVEPSNPAQFNMDGRGDRHEGGATDEEKEQQEAAEAMVFGEYRQRSRDRTNREGRCSLSMVEADHVTLEVKARGYATFVQSPFFAPENEEDDVVISLLGGGSLQARVTDTEGDPAASVFVQCRRESGERTITKKEKSDENGFADFEHLAEGTWEVRAIRVDNSLFAEGGRGSASHDAEWAEVRIVRGTQARIDLEVPAVGDLSGVVLLGGQPAPDVRVSLAPPESVKRAERLIELQDQFAGLNPDTTTGVTDFEGRFTLTDVIPGEYILLARHPDVAMVARTEVTVAAGQNSATVEIPGTSLEGRIVDDEGAPIAGAAIVIDRATDDESGPSRSLTRQFLGSAGKASATTDVDGVYRLLGVSSDVDLFIVVEAKGYADTRHGPVQAMAEETVSVPPIALERAGAVVVTTRQESTTAILSFVRARPLAGRALDLEADDKMGILRAGTARLDGLVSGTWEITVQFAGQNPGEKSSLTTLGPESVEIKPGETAELEL